MKSLAALAVALVLGSATAAFAQDVGGTGLPPEVTLHQPQHPIGTSFGKPLVTAVGKELIAHTPFGPIVILATGAETGGAVGIFRTTEPAGSVGPSHAHTHETEVFYILEGTYRFVTGGQTIEGGPGTTITIPPFVINHYENIGTTEGHLLVTETPGGFEQFFLDIERTGAATPAAIWELEKAHGIVDSSLGMLVQE